MRALTPPTADAVLYGQVLTALDAENVDATHLISAYEVNQLGPAKAFARRVDKLNTRLRSLNRDSDSEPA